MRFWARLDALQIEIAVGQRFQNSEQLAWGVLTGDNKARRVISRSLRRTSAAHGTTNVLADQITHIAASHCETKHLSDARSTESSRRSIFCGKLTRHRHRAH